MKNTWIFALLFMVLTTSVASAQLTHLVGSNALGTRKGLEALDKAKERDCRWKVGPESVRPENLAPEELNLVGQDDGPKVKRLCRGTIECDIQGERWHSDLYLICGMREASCKSARACWRQYLEDRLAFFEKPLSQGSGAKVPTTSGPGAGDGRD